MHVWFKSYGRTDGMPHQLKALFSLTKARLFNKLHIHQECVFKSNQEVCCSCVTAVVTKATNCMTENAPTDCLQ